MARKYNKKTAVSSDPIAAALAATMKPLMAEMVKEEIANVFRHWLGENGFGPASQAKAEANEELETSPIEGDQADQQSPKTNGKANGKHKPAQAIGPVAAPAE